MLKKIVAVMLVFAFMLALGACGEVPETELAEMQVEQVAQEEKKDAETEIVEVVEETIPEPTFTEHILVDDENCTVKITGIDTDNMWGYTLKVFLENKTELELMYSLDGVSVNGFMCDPFWASTVTANMKSNEEISFSEESFAQNGIDVPTEITFTLRIYDNNDWDAENLLEQEYTVYPLGEDAVKLYVREMGTDDIVLCENENCAIIVTGFYEDEIWGYTMQVYLENKTNAELMFSADGVAVNGFMCDPYWADTVAAGKRSNVEIIWPEESFAENGIEEVTEIVLPFRVYDNNDWDAEDVVNETYTVNP